MGRKIRRRPERPGHVDLADERRQIAGVHDSDLAGRIPHPGHVRGQLDVPGQDPVYVKPGLLLGL